MDIDFLQARVRMFGEYRTLSGISGFECPGGYFELYRNLFFSVLDSLGEMSREDLARHLKEVHQWDSVGDFLEEPETQLIDLCAFGLVLLDRMALTGWGRFDYERCFFLHEQLFECFEYAHDEKKKVSRARKSAAAKYKVNAEVRAYVLSEWSRHWQAYEGNKSEFARHYSVLVRQRFIDRSGAPFVVTEKTIREVWLKDTPIAGKEA